MRGIKAWIRTGCPQCKSFDFIAYFSDGENTAIKCRECLFSTQTSNHKEDVQDTKKKEGKNVVSKS